MMNKIIRPFIYLLMLLFCACKVAEKKPVLADTEQFTKIVSIYSDVGFDLDENEIDPMAERDIVVTIKNNSAAALKNLYLELQKNQSYIKFKVTNEGIRKSPGEGGTCRELLAPEETCKFVLSFIPIKKGKFSISVVLNYTNLILSEQVPFSFYGYVGLPADLYFTNDIAVYNLGSLEQTTANWMTYDVEVENRGELSARHLEPSILNLEGEPAFKIMGTNCPALLKKQEKCKVSLGYKPTNNGVNDPTMIYNGSFSLSYWRNPQADLSKLLASFTFKSFRLEADFTPTALEYLNFNSEVAGNYQDKKIVVKNVGVRSGKLLGVTFSDGTVCSKVFGVSLFSCSQTNRQIFPFRIYDDNNCFNKELNGISAGSTGDICTFKIRYWPTLALSATTNYPQYEMKLDYDSHWKGVWGETIKQSKIAMVEPVSAKTQGQLVLQNATLTFPSLATTSAITATTESSYVGAYNWGSLNMFSPGLTDAYFYSLKMSLKNTGGSPVVMSELYDGSTGGLKYNFINSTGTLAYRYYSDMKFSNCQTIAANGVCEITLSFKPTKQTTTLLDYQNAFDFVNEAVPANNLKYVNLKYNTSAKYDDNGNLLSESIFQIKNKMLFISEGLLVIPNAAITTATKAIGSAPDTKDLLLKNIGNGPIKINQADNLLFSVPFDSPSLTAALIGPYASTKGYFSIKLGDSPTNNCGLYTGTGVVKTLNAGESCNVRLTFDHPRVARNRLDSSHTNFFKASPRVEQLFGGPTAGGSPATFVSKITAFGLKYYKTLTATTTTATNTITVTSNFANEAEIIPVSPEPMHTAVIYRSPFTTNAVNGTGYPMDASMSGYTIPFASIARDEVFFDYQNYPYHFNGLTVSNTSEPYRNMPTVSSDTGKTAGTTPGPADYYSYWNKFFKAMSSMTFLKMNLTTNSSIYNTHNIDEALYVTRVPEDSAKLNARYIVFGGTLPLNVSNDIQVTLYNVGGVSATVRSLTWDTANTGVNGAQVSSKDMTGGAITAGTAVATNSNHVTKLKVTFKPTTVGTHRRCGTLKYGTGINDKNLRVCFYAEAISLTYANTSLYNYKPLLIFAQEKTGLVEYTSTLGALGTKSSDFYVIKDSLLTVEKIFIVKNNTNQTINNISNTFFINNTATPTVKSLSTYVAGLESTLTSTKIQRDTFTRLNSARPYCTNGMSLTAGQECEVKITYDPTGKGSESDLASYFSVIYELKTNQYTYQTAKVSFKHADPAGLTLYSETFSEIPLKLDVYSVGYYNPIAKTTTQVQGSYLFPINSTPAAPMDNPYVLGDANAYNTFILTVKNDNDLKVNFLGQWLKYKYNPSGDFKTYYDSLTNSSFNDFPVGDELIEIYTDNANTMRIMANRACFFGDDEGKESLAVGSDNYVARKLQGFNKDTVNTCQLRLYFSGYRTYTGSACATAVQRMGGSISQVCNPFSYALTYMTANEIVAVPTAVNIHLAGYIKPNTSKTYDEKISNMKITSSGYAKIDLPTIFPSNTNRGAIVGGLLCYDKIYDNLNSSSMLSILNDYVYNPATGTVTKSASKTIPVEGCIFYKTTDSYVELGGLDSGNYYFFKPFMIRTFNSGIANESNLVYSSNVEMGSSVGFVPTNDVIYNYREGILIDKERQSDSGTLSYAQNKCSSQYQDITLQMLDKKIPKTLITSHVFNMITESSTNSENYPSEGVGAITHWVNDPAYDIGNSISLYNGTIIPGFPGFKLSNLDGFNDTYKAIYQLDCNYSSECQYLYKLVGGDPGEGIYYEGVLYTGPNAVNAAVRCYTELVCPTNTNILINSPSCVVP